MEKGEKMIQDYIMLFFIYSILGWIMEVINGFIKTKKVVNRGFLIGPYCPIYGTGVILITILLKKYMEDRIITFIMSMLICGILEYFTSYFMEKFFNARWWDYSNRKMNINGRICLETLIPFGIFSFVILYFINPFFIEILDKLPEIIEIILAVVFSIILTIDTTISFKIILNLKQVSNLKTISQNVKDNTEEISQKVRKILQDKLKLHRRVVKAFPNIENTIKIKEWLNEKQERFKEIKEKYKK